MLKRKLQTLAKKLFPTYRKSCEAVEQNERLFVQLQRQQNQIEEIKQTVENESNWKRADIVNDVKPILAEIKQTVENESNWKRADIVNDVRRVIEWHSDRAHNAILTGLKHEDIRFWQLYSGFNGGGLPIQKKQFFRNIPKATGYMRTLQKYNAWLLSKFDEICAEVGLPYFIEGGTLLGAVRHHGTIPWDDDTDVGMMRKDAEKLKEYLQDSSDFHITLIYDWYAKCRQLRFRLKDPSFQGFVDVFMWDEVSDCSYEYWNAFVKERENLVNFFNHDASPEVRYWKAHPYLEENDANAKYIESIFQKYIKSVNDCDYSGGEKNCIIWGIDNISDIKWKRVFRKEFIFPCVKLEFENGRYFAPKEYISYTSLEYGDIYELPNDILTHVHHATMTKSKLAQMQEKLTEFLKLHDTQQPNELVRKYNIGYTAGVFDLFHVGHLNLLERCKKMCNYLIVAVCTDEYSRESGKAPVISYEDRRRIVGALDCVDEVVPMNFTDKLDAWKLYHFDVLFSGDDWKGTERYIRAEEQLKEVGVDVVYFSYTKSVSTSKLKEKIQGHI